MFKQLTRAVLSFSLLALPVHASTVFFLTQSGISGVPSGPDYAKVTLDQINTNTVQVTETLLNGDVLAVTGAGDALDFNTDVAVGLVPGSLTTGFTFSTGTFSFGSFGSFAYAVDCTSTTVCGNGTSAPRFGGSYSFEVTTTNPLNSLTASDFIANNAGYYFASDIGVPQTSGAFSTGVIGGNTNGQAPPPRVPEPSTVILMSAGIGALAWVRRNRTSS